MAFDFNKEFFGESKQEIADADYAKGYEHGIIAAKIFFDKIAEGSTAKGEPLSRSFLKGVCDAMRSELNEDIPNV